MSHFHSDATVEKINKLKDAGFTSREIAKMVFGKESQKSSVNEIVKRTSVKPQIKEDNSRILFISDLHIPYQHPDAFEFLQHLKDKYNPTRVISMGDECFPPDVEVLTEHGFVRFDKLKGEKVAQWEENGEVSFVAPLRKVQKEFRGDLIQYKHKTMVVRCTPNHNLVKIHPTSGKVHRREAWDSAGSESWVIPRVGKQSGAGVSLSDDEIRLMVAFQADGAFTKGAARFMFTKSRKMERVISLMKSCGIKYNTHNLKSEGYQYYIEKANVPVYFTKIFTLPISEFTSEQKLVFLNELGYWDGTSKKGRVRYVSLFKENIEYVQFMAVTAGCYSSKIAEAGDCHRVDIVWEKEKSTFKSAVKTFIPYNGDVYCVTVDTGMIIVRVDGCIMVTGNCDKHALSFHDSDPDLYSAGDELKASLPFIKELEKMFPKMDILDSNHGSLVWRKAKANGIPKHYIKSYNDVLGVSDDWKWHFDMVIELPNGQQCYLHHGKTSDVIKTSQAMGMSTIFGHFHERFKIDYWANPNGLYFGMSVGCLINDNALAFSYNNVNMKRPIIGTGLVIDSQPVLEPMLLGKDSRWIRPK